MSKANKTNHYYNMTRKENVVLCYEEHARLLRKKSYQLKEN